MDLPVASTANLIESRKTNNFHQDSIVWENETRQMKFAQKEPEESTDSATSSDSPLQFAVPVTMAEMKDEFRRILVSISSIKNKSAITSSSTYTDSELSSYSQTQEEMNSNWKLIQDEAVGRVRAIADRMIAAGYSKDCMKVYINVRKTVVDERFKELVRIERISPKNIQRLEWQVQQEKIQLWICGARVCVRSLFADERKLCKHIFGGLGTNIKIDDDACFVKTVKDSAIHLFNFVEAISRSRKSLPKKLFKILDVYVILSDLLPDIEAIFGSESGEFIRKQAVETWFILSEAARIILSEFEKAVFGEISKAPVPEGSVHPLTIYVMNYISSMVEYKQVLIKLIVSKPSTHSTQLDFDFSEFEEKGAPPLVLHLAWIIVVLKFNLQGKSKQLYKDTSLAHSFLKKNVVYIVQKIKISVELRKMIGDHYQNKLISLAGANYHKSSRNRILDCFRCSGF